MEKIPTKRCISVFTLAMINFAAIVSLRNLPIMATCGLSMLFFYSVAALTFFIPIALVSAELATTWPERGGLYVWVKEAMGPRWGFLAVWLQTVNSFVTFPAMLAFMTGALAYAIDPRLTEHKGYLFALSLGTFWVCTVINFKGMRLSSLISSIGSILGTLIPGALIIFFGLFWIFSGKPLEINFSWNAILPNGHWGEIVFLTSVMLAFAGIEMSAVHAKEVENPQRDYPRAILISTLLILFVSILGSLAIAVVVPGKMITLHSGAIQAFAAIFQAVNLSWLTPVVALLLAIGVIATISTWIVGPPRGLLVAAESGFLPPFLQSENKAGMPMGIMIFQAIIVSVFSAFFLVVPNASTAFWILTIIATQLCLLMYLLIFLAVIRLRSTHPRVQRPYRIPGGKIGLWLVAGMGILSCLFCMAIGFFPPNNLEIGSIWQFEGLMIAGTVFLIFPPFLFSVIKKDVWNPNGVL